MKWLRRQWHRFQLAHELLEQYEYEEAHRITADEAMRRLSAYGRIGATAHKSGRAQWAAAARAAAGKYPRA